MRSAEPTKSDLSRLKVTNAPGLRAFAPLPDGQMATQHRTRPGNVVKGVGP